ncbi:MAG: DUF512 domain-containing protein, partial [Clostridia bacterium]|nr:DUF512 domain-containing protein [Clostridia bacterium]
MVRITEVEPGSLADKAGILPRDMLLAINGNPITDVLDYRFYLAARRVDVSVLRGDEPLSFLIRKKEYDDVGLSFASGLMDEKRPCKNGCIFCFIDQLPKGMRETLYFKDDDSRLSFLHGNYITLTNLCDSDIDRIIRMRCSPINVSIHTTNPELRVKMMKNKRAGEVLSYLNRLAQASLSLRGQIVLCKGINDGGELERTMRDLSGLYPSLDSVSVVPAGLTKYRDGLYPLTPFTKEDCREIIRQVEAFACDMAKKNGCRVFAAADEFYLKADLPLPSPETYEGYPQIENGVGMIASLEEEFDLALADLPRDFAPAPRSVTAACGLAAEALMKRLKEKTEARFPQIHISVIPVKNRFFGEQITVSGLLTGRDLADFLRDKELGDAVLITRNALRREGDLFLCGMSLPEL